ncbi:MAG: adenylate/guanylate cyclase domain-containing protein [Alphaproteobacteria bacterium]|nr:adenylate/guanylate cyclase domain-containing protein [Alphaproteobacteria bacterium]
MRAVLHYLLAAPVLALFGCEVCPYIQGLGPLSMTVILLGCFVVALSLRRPLLRHLVDGRSPLEQAPYSARVDLGLFVAVAVGVGSYDTLIMGFPSGSGVKLLMGCVTLGAFAAADLALERQRRVLRAAEAGDIALPTPEQRSTVSRKLTGFTVAAFALVTNDLVLLILNDMGWLTGGAMDVAAASANVAVEIAVVMATALGHMLNLILSYSATLRQFLQAETRVLAGVSAGRLDQRVCFSSDDEFGQIALHTNAMIEGLQEREQVKRVLGKMVSPALARQLLDDPDRALRLGGERREVAVLFADLRGFTALSEGTSAVEVVALLNRYFSRAVAVIHGQGGAVDKFMGDGLMAVFFGGEDRSAASQAVAAALGLQRAVTEDLPGLAVGVGIHQGEVIAGNIGSPDRLEYTFIGDTVNAASRLEGVAKAQRYGVVISEPVHAELEPALRGEPWDDLGPAALRGRQQALQVWGLFPGQETQSQTGA